MTRTKRLVRCAMLAMLLGSVSCENRTDAEQKPAPSAQVPAPVDVASAQPPKLTDQAVLAPPSLSPELLPGTASSATTPASSAAALAPSAAAVAATASAAVAPPAAATANPKAPGDSPGIRVDTQTPGPMAPRTPKPADTM
ncbi:MAG: hypothetical protein IPM54_32635 [Polyangiaceae bacterium]|nr:hypothetical protein [Polyangiaceae bacterium]